MFNTPTPTIRTATTADFEPCLELDHSYETGRVWQLNFNDRDDRITINLQTVRLPHRLKVVYPHTREQLEQSWLSADMIFVAENQSNLCGYVILSFDRVEKVVWISEMAVHSNERKRGYGAHLLARTQQWARHQGARQLMAALPTRNYPAIEFSRKHGFTFSGYNETQFASGDIVLYFSSSI